MMTTLAALFGALPLYCRAVTARSCANHWGSPLSGSGHEPASDAVYHAGGVSLFDRLRLRFSRKPKQAVTE